MSETRFMEAAEAEEKVEFTSLKLLGFLASFNVVYPDQDSVRVASEFDYFTPEYVLRACAATLSREFVVTSQIAGPELRVGAVEVTTVEPQLEIVNKRVRLRHGRWKMKERGKPGGGAELIPKGKETQSAKKDKNDLEVS